MVDSSGKSKKSFQNGRIYKILNYIDNEVYVGSTCQPLSKRMAKHREEINNETKARKPLYIKMKEHGVEHFYIELIEEHPCENGEQLRKREGHYIREIGTLNKKIEGRTLKEYRDETKERIQARCKEYREENRERDKNYREENRERIQARCKEYRANKGKETYTCVCGSTCCINNKARHESTTKHLTFVEALQGE